MSISKKNFAITYTIKNEARLLPNAIKYHMAAGCSKIYVFLDGTTDGTEALVKPINGVEIYQTCKPNIAADLPAWISDILPMWEDNMDVRKRINTYRAAKMANEAGIEWLACIDPDELIMPLVNESIGINIIPDFLKNIPSDIDQILLRNFELVPSTAESDNPFVDGVYFLNRFPFTELIFRYSSALVRRLVRNPILHAWYEHIFYRLRFFGAWPRLMRHPVTGEKIPTAYFLGYVNHKSIIRTTSFSNFNFDIHRWRKYLKSPKSIYAGNVLHYDLFDYRYMAQKFRQRSASIVIKVFYCRYMFASVARDCSLAEVKKFFIKYLVLSEEEKIHTLTKKKILFKISSVSDFFKA